MGAMGWKHSGRRAVGADAAMQADTGNARRAGGRRRWPLWLACLATGGALLSGSAAAQMYSWKDAKGVTHFSDQPPPPAARVAARVLAEPSASPASEQVALPYGLAQAARRAPVVLYTAVHCGACDQGRQLLQQRGVPYTEKTVTSNDDQQQLKAAGSDARLPLLLVGAHKQIGFESVAWQEALSAADYPLQSRLPQAWRPAPPSPAAPRRAPTPVPRDAEPVAEPTPQKPPPLNAPPDFRF